MSKGITIQLQRIKSLYKEDGVTPVIVQVTDVNGTLVNMNITDFIPEYGEPLYVEDKGYLFIGDGVIQYNEQQQKVLVGSKIADFLSNHKYFVRAVDASIYGDYNYEKEISLTTEGNAGTKRIANTKFVRDSINALDGVITETPSASKTLTVFEQTDGKVTATFDDIDISYVQINDASPSTLLPKEDGTGTKTGGAEVGTSVNWSREDHIHPHDTTKADRSETITDVKYDNYSKTVGSETIATKAFFQRYCTETVEQYRKIADIVDIKANMALDHVDNLSRAEILDSPSLTGTATYNNKEIATHEYVGNSLESYCPYIYNSNVTAENITSLYPPSTTKRFVIDGEYRQWFSTGTQWKLCSTVWGSR